MTGVRFQLLTGTMAELRRFWSTFGVSFFPTGRGRSFDVAHTDGVFLVDTSGHLRVALVGTPNVHGRLPTRLERLLEPRGRAALAHPDPGWTAGEVVHDLGALLGKSIPDRPFP
jgi:cytochrome oxidase Cu insertion factor (SCO1/SenC/PrrC family)